MHVLGPCPSPSAVPSTARFGTGSLLPPGTGNTTTPDRSLRWIDARHPGDHGPQISTWPQVPSASPVAPPAVVGSPS